ncbi:GerAB/ArcD/ProY family transporter [Paenibacillus soyae]|uniref:Spore germination protein n=1 Tax=Paenibacillus soyae TaxID=2969249 RepID=A0A9X2MMQ7_9BACL|nr:spore germination protein [Paenibacillus soyae]MCR2802922.1 spore germination protein [Paenibacillus soyae]
MRSWEYGDERIGQKEMVLTTSSLMIGVGILTLPRTIAQATNASDGWLSILLAGGAAIFIAWLLARLSTRFRNRTFLEYTSEVASRPVAYVVGGLFAFYFLIFCAYITRSVAEMSKQYLFDRTPLEVISLCFMLIVIYAVSGSRTGLVRLTVLFLPFVFITTIVFLLLSINLFEVDKLLPLFHSDWKTILEGSQKSIFSFLGFEALLFYNSLSRKPEKTPKTAVISVLISVLLYVMIYVFTIAVFSNEVTRNIMYPTLELAREVSVPGEFFERLESLFLMFWVMSIFTTSAIALDVSIQSLRFFTKIDKKKLLYVLGPIIYLISMSPQNIVQLSNLGTLISYLGMLTAIAIPVLLLVYVKLREAIGHG